MLLQQSETEDPHKYLTLLYRVLLPKIYHQNSCNAEVPLSGRGLRMYDIVVSPLKSQIDLSDVYLVPVTPTTHSASDSKGSNRCLLWYFMVLSPSWEAQMSLANKEVSHILRKPAAHYHILWKPAVHYHIHESPLILPILSQIDPVYDPIILLENYKIILPSVTRSIKRSLSFAFPRKDPLWPSMWKSHGKFVDVTEWSSRLALNGWNPPPPQH